MAEHNLTTDWPGLNCMGDEHGEAVVPGCRHPYDSVAMLDLSTGRASAASSGLAYIAEHPEINQVVLAGTDSLALAAAELREVIERLRGIGHIGIIRFATRIPVTEPRRILDNLELLELFRAYSTAEQRIYVTAHVLAPGELADETLLAFQSLQDAGALVVSHTPVMRGINDDAAVLAELLDRLPRAGVTPYAFCILRPSEEMRDYTVPLEAVYRIVEEAKTRISGLGKRVRLTIAHSSGDIEILAIENGKAYLKYHRARDGHDGKFIIADCSPRAEWFDELPDGRREEENMEADWVDADPDFDLPGYTSPASRHYFTHISD